MIDDNPTTTINALSISDVSGWVGGDERPLWLSSASTMYVCVGACVRVHACARSHGVPEVLQRYAHPRSSVPATTARYRRPIRRSILRDPRRPPVVCPCVCVCVVPLRRGSSRLLRLRLTPPNIQPANKHTRRRAGADVIHTGAYVTSSAARREPELPCAAGAELLLCVAPCTTDLP